LIVFVTLTLTTAGEVCSAKAAKLGRLGELSENAKEFKESIAKIAMKVFLLVIIL
jgi:hypothetical protein